LRFLEFGGQHGNDQNILLQMVEKSVARAD
jgi:hypothetical protein